MIASEIIETGCIRFPITLINNREYPHLPKFILLSLHRFIVELQNGERHANLDNNRVMMKEGECVSFQILLRPSSAVKSITAIIEVAEPEKFKYMYGIAV